MSSPRTLPFCSGGLSSAKVLVIGHDPRLRHSDTVASYALFADYFFRPVPRKASEKAKYQLAEALFSYVGILTCFHYPAYQIAVTNLCNNALPHAPKGKTVLIPQEEAADGLAEIEDILSNSNIELVFPMSLQVNHWLQQLVFLAVLRNSCKRLNQFIEASKVNLPIINLRRLAHSPWYVVIVSRHVMTETFIPFSM